MPRVFEPAEIWLAENLVSFNFSSLTLLIFYHHLQCLPWDRTSGKRLVPSVDLDIDGRDEEGRVDSGKQGSEIAMNLDNKGDMSHPV